MTTVVTIVLASMAVLVVAQALLVVGFVWRLLRFRAELLTDAECPRGAVILCLRGADPFLKKCISGLLNQDYPNYEIHVVVDHPNDPANAILRDSLVESAAKVHIQFLENPSETCSLKCASVVQAVRSLDESVDFIAQLDADTIPHATWLRELATGLADERVGAATGNRWYMPDKPTFASLIRYAWNAAAVVEMYWYQIAWGGTLAVKTRVFRETDLLDKWSNAFCEDTMLYSELKRSGFRLNYVPSLTMINREDCDLGGYFRWVQRQLLTARLYHHAWGAVLGHGVMTILTPLLALALAVTCYLAGLGELAVKCIAGVVLYQVAVAVMLPPMEFAVRRIAAARDEPNQWLSYGNTLRCALAIVLTHYIYFAALCSAAMLRVVDWRGVGYQITGRGRVRRLSYAPYAPTSDESEDNTSL